jgi:hypothetical protein
MKLFVWRPEKAWCEVAVYAETEEQARELLKNQEKIHTHQAVGTRHTGGYDYDDIKDLAPKVYDKEPFVICNNWEY